MNSACARRTSPLRDVYQGVNTSTQANLLKPYAGDIRTSACHTQVWLPDLLATLLGVIARQQDSGQLINHEKRF